MCTYEARKFVLAIMEKSFIGRQVVMMLYLYISVALVWLLSVLRAQFPNCYKWERGCL